MKNHVLTKEFIAENFRKPYDYSNDLVEFAACLAAMIRANSPPLADALGSMVHSATQSRMSREPADESMLNGDGPIGSQIKRFINTNRAIGGNVQQMADEYSLMRWPMYSREEDECAFFSCGISQLRNAAQYFAAPIVADQIPTGAFAGLMKNKNSWESCKLVINIPPVDETSLGFRLVDHQRFYLHPYEGVVPNTSSKMIVGEFLTYRKVIDGWLVSLGLDLSLSYRDRLVAFENSISSFFTANDDALKAAGWLSNGWMVSNATRWTKCINVDGVKLIINITSNDERTHMSHINITGEHDRNDHIAAYRDPETLAFSSVITHRTEYAYNVMLLEKIAKQINLDLKKVNDANT